MFEILIRIETLCLDVRPLVLVGSGLVITILGMLLWLAGSYFSSVILGLLGAVVGSSCGLLVSQWFDTPSLVSMCIGAVVFAIAAVLFRNVLIIILAAIVFALAGGTAYSSFVLTEAPEPSAQVNTRFAQPFSAMDSSGRLSYVEQIAEAEASFFERLKLLVRDALDTISPHKWKVLGFAVVGGVAGLLLIWFIRTLIMALCYSGVGTLVVLIGAEVLLLGMKFHLSTWFQERRAAFTITYVSMVVVGALVQLIVMRSSKKAKQRVQEGDSRSEGGRRASQGDKNS